MNNAMRQTTPPPTGTQYFTMDDVSVPEQFGVRQAPVQEPRAQEGIGRHTEVSFELVLDPVVPQLGRKKAVWWVRPDDETQAHTWKCWLAGRNTIIDTYGCWCGHGVEHSRAKVDKSTVCFCRHMAKSALNLGLAKFCIGGPQGDADLHGR